MLPRNLKHEINFSSLLLFNSSLTFYFLFPFYLIFIFYDYNSWSGQWIDVLNFHCILFCILLSVLLLLTIRFVEKCPIFLWFDVAGGNLLLLITRPGIEILLSLSPWWTYFHFVHVRNHSVNFLFWILFKTTNKLNCFRNGKSWSPMQQMQCTYG